MTVFFHRYISCLCFLVFIPCLAASPPKRVVSQAVGTDDLLLALADPSQIAALSHLAHDSLFAPDVAAARRYPTLRGPSAEDILRFKPDLVLVASYSSPESVAILKKNGVRLFTLEKYETLDDVYASMRLLGDILGHRQKAENLIATCRARVASLALALKGVKPIRVISAAEYPYISGSGTSFQELCDHAGAINVASEAGIKGVVPTPAEKLLAWDIDMLVGQTEQRQGESGPRLIERLKDAAPYRFLKAYKQGKVIEIPASLFLAASHHRIAAFEALAKALHPDRFAVSEPQSVEEGPIPLRLHHIWWSPDEQTRLPDGQVEQRLTLAFSPFLQATEQAEVWLRITKPKLSQTHFIR
jgi:iron complex transport system substrate-binding protein